MPNTRTTRDPARARPDTGRVDDPLWYKDAVIYQAHVRAFFDSNGNGMGDFQGLTQKLDYLRDLGITAIWLLPFYPSPWRDDGYDIADYADIHPSYGTMADFKRFMREARARGLRVITELVINHTSDQHPWFQRARHAKRGSAARDFYVWSDDPRKYREARIIFKDFESSNWSWDPVAKQYFWHRFYSHQPDLNFDNPAVHDALLRLMDFWFRLGVDGMRLDAIPYLYEREGTNCENLPETHGFLKKMRAHLDAQHRGRMFLAEANQWPEETVPYFGDGDECHMAFHFPVMPRLFMSIQMEDRFPIIDILKQTPPIPDNCQWATFLRNHDELTLEMVTDEERDYMYRMYASDPQSRINLGIRRRLAPLLGSNRRKIEPMNSLLFSLPGTPVLYYGDEIGMGDNIYLGDRNGVRTPMQWSPDRNAGFSRANPQRLYLPVIVDPEYHYETVNVEAQQANPSSLLWWTKRLIGLRKRFQAFGRGSIEFLYPDNRKVLAFLRTHEDEIVLVVANLSRFVQYARLDLSRFRDHVPVELFGLTEFPRIGAEPFFVTLGPHAFYWFQIRPADRRGHAVRPDSPAEPAARLQLAAWRDLVSGGDATVLEPVLRRYITGQRWFQGKGRPIRGVAVTDLIPTAGQDDGHTIALVEVRYVEEQTETYVLPLLLLRGAEADRLLEEQPRAVIAHLTTGDDSTALMADASFTAAFRGALLDLVQGRRRLKGTHGEIHGNALARMRQLGGGADAQSRLVGAEQSNTSIVFGRAVVLKLYRRLEDGVSLDLEMGRFLGEHDFGHTPHVLGSLDYRREPGSVRTLAVAQQYVPNEGDAWDLTLDALREFYERAATGIDTPSPTDASVRALLRLAAEGANDQARALVGPYLEEARLLGERTADMHRVLASDHTDPAFAPEEFTLFYQRSLYQSMRNLTGRVLQQLATQVGTLPDSARGAAQEVLQLEAAILRRLRTVVEAKVTGYRIRCHGDLHLGQVLYTGNDFFITDFEGEPIRPLSERRLKRSPLRDVAGMLRSFHYAAYTGLLQQAERGHLPGTDRTALEWWTQCWHAYVSGAFLNGYLPVMAGSDILPRDAAEIASLLDAFLLDKAVYELGYELGNRPAWAEIPLRGLLQLLEGEEPGP
jgi:maltose alpha-D-glucosyltransferase / alpha-amylase